METLSVTFSVVVSPTQYSFSGPRGSADVQVQLTRNLIESIDPGRLFKDILQTALEDFDKPAEDEEDA